MKTSVCQGNVDTCKLEETYLVLPFMSRNIVSILETLRDSLDQGNKLDEVSHKSFPIVDLEKDKCLGLLWKAAPAQMKNVDLPDKTPTEDTMISELTRYRLEYCECPLEQVPQCWA